MPTYPNARPFRAGLPGRNIASNFSIMNPGVYDPVTNPSPFGFKLPSGYKLPQITPLQGDSNVNGEPLPLGAPVAAGNVPGVYESGTSQPLGQDPLASSAPRSKYTLTGTDQSGGPQNFRMNPGSKLDDPAFQQTGANGTALALQQIYSADSGMSGAAARRPAGRGGYNPASEMGPAAGVLQAANGFEAEKVAYAARDALGRPSARTYNKDGVAYDQSSNAPLGTRLASDTIVSPFDTPEIRASKQTYQGKLIRDLAQKTPGLARNGEAASTQEMSSLFQRMMTESGQPRLRNLGVDSFGRPVEGIQDPNGNFSRITPEKDNEKVRFAQPEYSKDGKMFRSGPDDEWHPAPANREKPLTVTEWFMSGKPEGTYADYRRNFTKEMAGVDAEDGAPSAAIKPRVAAPDEIPGMPDIRAQTPAENKAQAEQYLKGGGQPVAQQGPQVTYNHNDVLKELERRGIKRK